MKIKYFTESAYLDLFDAVPNNAMHYTDKDNSWIMGFFGDKQFFKESRIEGNPPELDADSDEFTNVTLFYDAFRDKLSPKQASNPYLWAYLTHFQYWDFATKRWAKEGMSTDTIKQRFFCSFLTRNAEGNRVGFLRNAVARLWWMGYLTYQEERRGNPYELTKLLTSNSDITQQILERNFSMNRNVTMGILEAILEINNDPNLPDVGISKKYKKDDPDGDRYEWRSLCKYINRYGAVTLLDSMTKEDIKELSYKFILKQREE